MVKVGQSGEKYISAGAQYNIGRAYFQVIVSPHLPANGERLIVRGIGVWCAAVR